MKVDVTGHRGLRSSCRAAAVLVFTLTTSLSASASDEEKHGERFSETIQVIRLGSDVSVVQAPVAVTVIDSRQIETSSSSNVADLLRAAPGVVVIQTSARDFDIRTRGAASVAEHRQLVLVDGTSVYLDFYGIVLWDALPFDFDAIRQIEVQQGPGSALWGPNALAGVINLRTKSPREMQGGSLRMTAGERGTRGASLRWGEAFRDISYSISASLMQQDAWARDDVLPNGTPLPKGYQFANRGTREPKAEARIDWGTEDNPAWSFRAGFGGTTGIFHSRLGPFLIEPGTYTGHAEIDRNTKTVETKAYWNRLHGNASNLLNGIAFAFDTDTYAAEATNRHTIGTNQLLVYGANVRENRFSLSIAPDASARHEVGAFVEDSIVTRHVTINGSVRIDQFNSIGTEVSPRASVVWQPRPGQAMRLAYNRAYRAPSVTDMFLDTAVPSAIQFGTSAFTFMTRAEGNRELHVELVNALELGYTFEYAPRSLVAMSIYRNATKNNIVFVPTSFYSPSDPPAGWPLPASTVPRSQLPKTLGFVNIGRVVDEGLELSWNAAWNEWLSTRASYTRQRTPAVTNNGTIPLRVNRPPRNEAALTTTCQMTRAYSSVSASYTGSAFWADVLDSRFWGSTHPYLLIDASLGVDINPKLKVIANVNDLADRKVKEHVFGDIIRRRAILTLQYRFDASRAR